MYKGNRFIASVIFSVLCFAINDGFWDPNYKMENNYKTIGVELTDGKGPNLELGGIPYDYIPSFLLLVK